MVPTQTQPTKIVLCLRLLPFLISGTYEAKVLRCASPDGDTGAGSGLSSRSTQPESVGELPLIKLLP